MGTSCHNHSCRFLSAVFLVGFFVMPLLSAAQLREMDISQMEAPADRFTVFTEHPDEAYIIIQSPVNNLVFTSNMDGIVEDRSEPDQGRYVLIVRPFTQIFTVNAPGYMVGRFRVQSPQARNTYHYRIRPVEATTEFIPVNFIVDQENANLFVDDQEVPIGRTVRMEPGPQSVRIEKPGYRTIIDEIVITHDNTLFQYTLDELYEIPVTIRSNPSGATVYINTIRQDRETNFQDFFYPGEYLVRAAMSGYRDMEKQIVVTEEGPNNFLLELERFVGTLSLSVEPANARITINNRDYSGQRDIALPPGVHRILVEREGFNTYDDRIVIQEGEQVNRSVRLVPRTGTLVFSIEQADAEVTLYNQRGEIVQQWRGINRIPDLPVGTYQYTASMEGYPQLDGQFTIRDNMTERVRADFSELADQALTREAEPAAPEDDVVARLEEQSREMREITDQRIQERQISQPEPQQPQPEARPQPVQPTPASTRNPFHAPIRMTAWTLSYADMWIDTDTYDENADYAWGLTMGSIRTRKYWAANAHLGFGQIHLQPLTGSFIIGGQAEDHINVMYYGLKVGPKLGIGPVNIFALVGVDGSILFHDAFEDSSFSMMDGATELGIVFIPSSWRFGLKYSISIPWDTQDDFLQFTRMEFGIIFVTLGPKQIETDN